MSFFAGIFLWSLSLLSIPILIALWNRRRRQRLAFGAYYLLRKVAETTRRRIQVLQILKLINRIALVSFLILFFAEPQTQKDILEEAGSGFVFLLDGGRVMQAQVDGSSLIDLQKEKAKDLLEKMPSSSKGGVFFVGARCRALKLKDGRTVASAQEWVEALAELSLPHSNEPTSSSGFQDCLGRGEALFAGKSYYKVFISPLPASLDLATVVSSAVRIEKLPSPQVRLAIPMEVRQEREAEQARVRGLEGRQLTLIRPPEKSVKLGLAGAELEIPLTQSAWILAEQTQESDPWEGAAIISLDYEAPRELSVWASKESDGFSSLVTALRANPRLRVLRQLGSTPSGEFVIIYGPYSGSLESFKKVWIFQSPEAAAVFAVRDQKQWSSTEAFADLKRSFIIQSPGGEIFVRRYSLLEGDSFETLESFQDGAPSLLQARLQDTLVWLTPFDLEDLTTDLALQPVFIPYLYRKLDQWLGSAEASAEGTEAKALWLMRGSSKPSPEVIRDLAWPGIYQIGSQIQVVEPLSIPIQFLTIENRETTSSLKKELVSLRAYFLWALLITIFVELLLCFAAARWGWLLAFVLCLGSLQATPLLERTPVGFVSGMQPDRLRSLSQLLRESAFMANLEFSAPRETMPQDFWKYSMIFASGSRLPNWGDADRVKIREYLEKGGLMVFDEPLATLQTSFRADVEELIAKTFPGRQLEPIPSEDVLFRTFYLLSEVSGRRLSSPELSGLKLDSRWVVVFSSNDLLGAIQRGPSGDYQLSVTPYGVMQRTLSQRLLMNLFFYSLTVDYKDDAIHLPHILKRRSR